MRIYQYQVYPGTSAQLNFSQPNSMQPATTGVGNTFSSSAQKIEYGLGYCVQAVYTGNINGTISLNASNDGLNFSTISGTPTVIIPPGAGSTGNFLWNVQQANYLYTQFAFAASSSLQSSTGTLRAVLVSKGF
jgi:hypothetical protein